MAIYYGHFSPMPDNFQPPRAGTMPKRGPIASLGITDKERQAAQRRSESIGHNPTGAYGRRYRRTKP